MPLASASSFLVSSLGVLGIGVVAREIGVAECSRSLWRAGVRRSQLGTRVLLRRIRYA